MSLIKIDKSEAKFLFNRKRIAVFNENSKNKTYHWLNSDITFDQAIRNAEAQTGKKRFRYYKEI